MPEETASARHWLWVAGPDYYLDESQKERPDLEPAAGFSPSAWWTCSPQTRAGDTVLLYRSKTKKDIAHFLVVRSDAEPLDLPGDPFHGKHVCQYEVIERLRTPVSWDTIKTNHVLRDWHAVKTRFVKSSFEVPDDCWRELIVLANNDPDLLAKEATDGLHRIRLEREIQRRLIERPELLAQAGLRGLTFVKHEFLFANGRRADLVYTQGFGPLKRDIIVELKRGEVGTRAIEQVNDYADQLSRDPRRSRLRPRTVVIGEKLQAEAEKLVGRGSRGKPRFYALAELKIERL